MNKYLLNLRCKSSTPQKEDTGKVLVWKTFLSSEVHQDKIMYPGFFFLNLSYPIFVFIMNFTHK